MILNGRTIDLTCEGVLKLDKIFIYYNRSIEKSPDGHSKQFFFLQISLF